ncbi:hypothetical protein [Oceanobacillus bengalensis]|uniref:Uncharacterized protein n=1 Tax=Oceanobacillus bengalensis TaxID=1435466 RepID=A0A494YTM5_9BACI|nr:hypothetical protein [Oceanobacillus bengalensis]RKQ13487.1 hypothetical protein D8M05_16065 [Oceanobacillus bengalensis]
MEIDFSPLESSLNTIGFGLIKTFGIPFIGALLIGFLLRLIKAQGKLYTNSFIVIYIRGLSNVYNHRNLIKYQKVPVTH